MVYKITKDCAKSGKKFSEMLVNNAGIRSSAQTVHRVIILYRAGLKAAVKSTHNFLSKKNVAEHLAFCRKCKDYTIEG